MISAVLRRPALRRPARVTARALLSLLLIGMATLQPLVPDPARAQDRIFPQLDEDAEIVLLFVAGNTLFTLYHEVGHALVDQLGLPVLGREEDAADSFATVQMVPDAPDPLLDELLLSAADGFDLMSATEELDDQAFLAAHPLDQQRFFRTACLIVGSDPEGFREYGIEIGLSEGRLQECPELWDDTRVAWAKLLAPYRPASGSRAAPIAVTWGRATGDAARIRDLLRESELIDGAALDLAGRLNLPAPVPVRFEQCGEPNAFYDPDGRRITMCYELPLLFEALIVEALEQD